MTVLGLTREYRTHLRRVFTWPKSTPEEAGRITWTLHHIYMRYKAELAAKVGTKAATQIADLVLDEETLRAA